MRRGGGREPQLSAQPDLLFSSWSPPERLRRPGLGECLWPDCNLTLRLGEGGCASQQLPQPKALYLRRLATGDPARRLSAAPGVAGATWAWGARGTRCPGDRLALGSVRGVGGTRARRDCAGRWDPPAQAVPSALRNRPPAVGMGSPGARGAPGGGLGSTRLNAPFPASLQRHWSRILFAGPEGRLGGLEHLLSMPSAPVLMNELIVNELP